MFAQFIWSLLVCFGCLFYFRFNADNFVVSAVFFLLHVHLVLDLDLYLYLCLYFRLGFKIVILLLLTMYFNWAVAR